MSYDVGILYAAGDGKRWGWNRDTPKHLVEVDGETILARHVRLLREAGIVPVIVTHNPELMLPGADHLQPEDRTFLVSSVVSSAPVWTDSNLGIMADAWIDDETWETIMQHRGLHWFGRAEDSPLTGGPPEIWAFSWERQDNGVILESMRAGEQHARDSGLLRDEAGSPVGGVWQPYRYLARVGTLDQHLFEDKIWVECGGWSIDFDWPELLNEWYVRRRAAGLPT